MKNNQYYPLTTTLQHQQVAKGVWVARVYDFFCHCVFATRGRTRREVDQRARRFRDEFRATARQQKARMKSEPGRKWKGRFLPRRPESSPFVMLQAIIRAWLRESFSCALNPS